MCFCTCFFFNGTATTEIYTYCHTLSLHDALPIFEALRSGRLHVAGVNTGSNPIAVACAGFVPFAMMAADDGSFGYEMEIIVPADSPIKSPEDLRSEEHTSELQSLMRISYAVFCLKKKNTQPKAKQRNNKI